MTALYLTVSGHSAVKAQLHVGNVGPWYVDLDMEGAPALSGRVTVKLGSLELEGTVDPEYSGEFGDQQKLRVIAGAGGWSKLVTPKPYSNDAGVKARSVAEDAARAVGETIGTFVPAAERIGSHYTRMEGPASRTLEDVIDRRPGCQLSVAWWVDYQGVTHAGARPTVTAPDGSYEVLAFDPRERIATLGVEDPASIVIGSVLFERLGAPQTVRELELTIDSDEVRVKAWCGGSESRDGKLPGLFRSIIERASDTKLVGKYRYRVVRMAGDRVELQAVRKGAGLPDVLPVSQWPGLPGVHSELADGAIVLVEFVEGDRTLPPVITAYAPGQPPKTLLLEVSERLDLGGEGGAASARKGDSVEALLPPAVFTGTIGGQPSPPVPAFATSKLTGTITTGSAKVKST